MRMKWWDVKTRPLATTIQRPQTVRRVSTTAARDAPATRLAITMRLPPSTTGRVSLQTTPVRSARLTVRCCCPTRMATEFATKTKLNGCTNPFACNYNEFVTDDDGSCEFLSCIVFGCIQIGACNYDPEANYSDGSCEYLSCQGCLNPSACNYDETATIAGICDYTSCVGCTDPAADNYDATATIEGSCEYLGCTSFTACNYDPNANVNDGSCEFLSCVGCLNSAACNYDENATQSGSCVYPIPGFNCDGTCIDTDMDGVCDADEVLGCTDETALNYDADATEDAGNCVLPVLGCTDPTACNYDASANTNDGSCDFESCYGCLNENACNYDAGALYSDAAECVFADANACESCEGGAVVLNDADGDGVCDADEVSGCQDATACNYNEAATDDDGSCDVPVAGCEVCVNGASAAIDTDGDGVADCDEVAGCTDAMACNYDTSATDDDGSCDVPVAGCEVCVNGASAVIDTDGDGVGDCDENVIEGSTNPLPATTTNWRPTTTALVTFCPALCSAARRRGLAITIQRPTTAMVRASTSRAKVARTRVRATTTRQPPLQASATSRAAWDVQILRLTTTTRRPPLKGHASTWVAPHSRLATTTPMRT